MYGQQKNTDATEDTNAQLTSSTTQSTLLPTARELLSATTTYSDLNDYEKSLVQKYAEHNPDVTADFGSSADPTRYIHPIFYDDSAVLFGLNGFKGLYYRMADVHTFDNLELTFVSGSGAPGCQQYTNYILCISDGGIYYFKTGAHDFELLPGSSIANAQNETYIEFCNPGGCDEETAYDESTRSLSVSVFDKKTVNDSGIPPRKVRTAIFTLP